MKKIFLFVAAIVVVILASCSNEDVVDTNKKGDISFRASLDKATTRANVTSLQNLAAFNVTAIGNGSNYFTDMSVTSLDRGNNWNTGASFPWPGFNLAFFAYAPQTPGGVVSITNAGKKITGFSPEQAVAQQKDLVISYNTGNRNTNNDTPVTLNFKHALSQIEVKAKCGNDKIKIEVIGIKMVNVAAKANFTFPESVTNTSYSLQQNQWTDLTEKDNHSKAYMIKGSDVVVLNNEPQSIMFGDNNFMLIPQPLTKWDGTASTSGAYLSVLCRISVLDNGNQTQIYPQPVSGNSKNDKYAFAAVGIDTNWEPGKKYTYTLNFCENGGGAGEIDPTPVNPVDPVDPTVDPIPVPGGNGGDPILGNSIRFTVTVDNWMSQPVNINM